MKPTRSKPLMRVRRTCLYSPSSIHRRKIPSMMPCSRGSIFPSGPGWSAVRAWIYLSMAFAAARGTRQLRFCAMNGRATHISRSPRTPQHHVCATVLRTRFPHRERTRGPRHTPRGSSTLCSQAGLPRREPPSGAPRSHTTPHYTAQHNARQFLNIHAKPRS